MNKVIIAAALALSFTTGFTCSKQAPEAPPSEMPAPPQEEMAAPPADGAAAPAPAEGTTH